MRKRRQQFGGVYLDPRFNIWYYRRKVNGKRQLTRIGKLSCQSTRPRPLPNVHRKPL